MNDIDAQAVAESLQRQIAQYALQLAVCESRLAAAQAQIAELQAKDGE